jgi:hypothetical protein
VFIKTALQKVSTGNLTSWLMEATAPQFLKHIKITGFPSITLSIRLLITSQKEQKKSLFMKENNNTYCSKGSSPILIKPLDIVANFQAVEDSPGSSKNNL